MSKEKRNLRKTIKRESRELVKQNRWNLVLGDLLVSTSASTSYVVVGMVFGGPLTFGLTDYSLKTIRNERRNTGTLFKGFSKNFGKTVGLYFLEFIYLLLWFLLFIIPGIIKSFSYSMAFYILADNPELGPKEAITKSREMMKGHKWELFVLYLSYIGWIFLSILTFGLLAIFFVGPWTYLAAAKFYQTIKDKN